VGYWVWSGERFGQIEESIEFRVAYPFGNFAAALVKLFPENLQFIYLNYYLNVNHRGNPNYDY
jgi:hypothetical protein